MAIPAAKIAALCRTDRPLLNPFSDKRISGELLPDDADPFGQCPKRIIGYGLGSIGYGVRLGASIMVHSGVGCTVLDPMFFDEKSFVDIEADVCIIPPNSFASARTVELLHMPPELVATFHQAQEYLTVGLSVECYPLGPGDRGELKLTIRNPTSFPAKVYPGQGIGLLMFHALTAG